MNTITRSIAAALTLGIGMLAAQPAMADIPGVHPGYVRALNDLRYAHSLLAFPAEWNVTSHERAATTFVNRAFGDIRQAGVDDGKNVFAPSPVDANLSHRDRLASALVAIDAAHRDINGWETNGAAIGPRDAADGDLNAADAQVRAALHDQYRDHAFGY